MMRKTVIGLLGVACLLAGCAGVPRRPASLHVTISPEKIYPGCVVIGSVKAPAGSTRMTGRLDVSGSPVIPLRSEDDGVTWMLKTQIPLDAFWQPGTYRVVVEGFGPDGAPLWGETQVIAP